MQDIGNALETKRPATINNIVYIHTAISKPMVTVKGKSTIDTHTHKRKRNPNTTLK